MNISKPQTSLENHQEVFKKLAHFLPPDNCADLPESILNFLVKHVLLANEALDSNELGRHIKNQFHLEFESEEIEQSLRVLIQSSLVIKKGNKLFLNIEERKKLEEARLASGQREKEFYNEVRGKFLEQDPTLNSNELDVLCEDFGNYLNFLFTKVGAEAIHFLYPDENKLKEALDSGEGQEALSVLPERDEHINKFRRLQFPLVLKHISPRNKAYLSDKLNTVFVYTLVSIDPQCSAYLQKTLRGYSLYLDTNFIYNLLGLDGEELENSAKKLLEIAQKFNFKLFITLRTLEEFNASLSNAETFLRSRPLPTKDPELLRVGAGVLEEAFIKAYWRRYADENLGLEEFLSFYKNVKPLLMKMGVKINDNLVKITEQDKTSLTQILEGIKRFAPNKNEFVATHDAFHILLMEKIREEHLRSGSTNIKQWFLTNDRSLIRYELSVGKKKIKYYSHCILPEHLLQILRPLLPRSADFQQSLIEFISGRQQFGISFMSSPSVAYNVLARLDRYKTRPKEVAIKVLTDVHFNHYIKSIKNREQRDEEIDSELLKQAEAAIKEKEAAVRMAKQVGGHRDRLEKENQELRGFRKEVEEGRKRRNKALAWGLFVVIGISSFFGLLYLISKSAILLDVKGAAFVFLVFIALLIWLVILLVVARIVPGHESLREDIKSVLGIAKKGNDLFKNN